MKTRTHFSATDVFISVGSNIDRHSKISKALTLLGNHFGILGISSVYETPAHGFSGQPFYNLVVFLRSHLTPPQLRRRLRRIERQCGRVRQRGDKFISRTVDLDILIWGYEPYVKAGFKLPSQEFKEHRFIGIPLMELLGNINDRAFRCRVKNSLAIQRKLWCSSALLNKSNALTPVVFYWRGRRLASRLKHANLVNVQ